MILLTILAIILILLIITAITVLSVGGFVGVILFGDVIACIAVIVFIIRRKIKRR